MGHYAVDFQCIKCGKCNCICPRPAISEKSKKQFKNTWLKVVTSLMKKKANHD